MSEAAIAMNRFGLGVRRDESPPADPRGWLTAQIAGYQPVPASIAAVPTSFAVAADIADYRVELRKIRQTARAGTSAGVDSGESTNRAMTPLRAMAADAKSAMIDGGPAMADGATRAPGRDAQQQERRIARRAGQDNYGTLVGVRAAAAIGTTTPFAERLVHFWSNHFAVSADKLELIGLAGTLEMEAIRPHVMGRFADMLFAVERHPAMLLYLDQAVSVGPDSPLGARVAARGQRKVGLNENLAREIMELHTLGVRTGYSQADVTEFARAMTGWTVGGIGGGPGARFAEADGQRPGTFVFAAPIHQPGARTVMGKTYAAGGEAQAQAVLADLSVHPATARHIATKLARHFAGDTPPPAMVARLEQAFLRSGGDLPTLYRALIASPEAWVPTPVKFKTPWEWTVSCYRALGTTDIKPQAMLGLMNQLGQPIWKPGQPIGYDDTAPSWAGPDAVMRRVEAAERFAARLGGTIDARALAQTLFPGMVSPATAQALNRAESPGQALALLLVSPEMMRR